MKYDASLASTQTSKCLWSPFQQSKSAALKRRRSHSLRKTVRQGQKAVYLHDFHDQLIPYEKAWGWQHELVKGMLEKEEVEEGNSCGHIIILQHPQVLTLGAGSTEKHLKFNPQESPLPLFRTERGGEVTFHGPGQLVMYPILNLRNFSPDLHWYLRSLEEVVIKALHKVSGLYGSRSEGQTGVWVDDKKVAAIGIRARRWISYHGLALNVTTDLQPYSYIVPCGISDKPVTRVLDLLGISKEYHEDGRVEKLLHAYCSALLSSFETVFGVDLIPAGVCLPHSNVLA